MRPRALPARSPKPGPARVPPGRPDRRADQRVDIAAASDAPLPDAIPARPSGPAAVAAWARGILGQIHGIEDRIGLDFYRIGQRLRELSDRNVYGALGFASFGQLLEAHGVMSRFWATQLIRISVEYSPAQARTLGVSKAWAVISYAAAAGRKPAELVDRNAEIEGKPLAGYSVRALQAAAARERARRRGLIDAPAHHAAERAARKVSRALRARGARDASVRLLLRGSSWRIRVEVAADIAVAAIVGAPLNAASAPASIPASSARRAARRAPGRAPPR